MVDTTKYSPEAQELIRIATAGKSEARHGLMRPNDDFDLAATVQARPDLMPGLNEYVRWTQEVGEAVDQVDAARAVEHPLKGALGKPRPK